MHPFALAKVSLQSRDDFFPEQLLSEAFVPKTSKQCFSKGRKVAIFSTTSNMSDTTSNNHTTASLFQVYLRLKPAVTPATGAHTEAAVQERYLRVEEANSADAGQDAPTHITVIPPVDSRRRAVEKFAFTRVFQEEASQLDVFQGTNLVSLIEGVLAPEGKRARDGLIATLGVTGSGKVRRPSR